MIGQTFVGHLLLIRDFDETWVPAGLRNMVIRDAEETSEEEVGGLSDGSVPHAT